VLQQQVQPQAPRFIKAPPPKASRMRLHIPSCIVEMHWRFVSNMCRCVWTVMHWSIIRVTTCQNSILPQTITWFHNVWTLMLKMLVQFIRWSGMMWNFDKRNRFTHITWNYILNGHVWKRVTNIIQKTCQVATIKDFLVAPTLKPHLSDAETAYSGPQADTAINHPKKKRWKKHVVFVWI